MGREHKFKSQIVYTDEAGIDNRDEYPYGYCEIGKTIEWRLDRDSIFMSTVLP